MVLDTLARRAGLSLGVAGAALALSMPALAQAPAPSTQELLDQIRILQKRIEQLEAAEKRRQGADAQTRAAARQPAAAPPPARTAAVAPATAPAVPPPAEPASAPVTTAPDPAPQAAARESDKPNGTFMLGAAKLTLGGYIDLTGYYRSRNENRGTGTGYNTIPFYGPTPQGNSGEYGMSAQQTRLALRLDVPVGVESRLTAYGEMDFNNGSGGANSVQSNSYTPRLRQVFGQYQDESWQAYLLAGQAWTLATPFRKGLDPFGTWQPPTIDHNYMVGYNYLRVPMVRAVKGFGNFWMGIEANTPQTVFGGTATVPAGQTVYTGYPGNSGLNPQAVYSVNVAPDIVAKVALDTKYGHVDAFGVARWFRDQVSFGTTSVNHDAFGGGFGVSAFIPAGKWADLMGSFVYGSGIGRYGAAGLPDVTFTPNGGLTTLPQGMGTVGAVAHIVPSVLDLYGFYGWNWVGSSYYPGGGYGNPGFNNTGCFNPNAGGANCAGNTRMLSEVTVGLNWNFLRGRFGTLRAGLQYGNILRTAYYGTGGTPSAVENLFMFNFRYIPFE
ncbi:hypothetical protein [Reyranella sp.]|uniref:hypothetical protein n=1 Tax=Reyranella sp. TaxID=1929291 RepID=UPI003BAC4E39